MGQDPRTESTTVTESGDPATPTTLPEVIAAVPSTRKPSRISSLCGSRLLFLLLRVGCLTSRTREIPRLPQWLSN